MAVLDFKEIPKANEGELQKYRWGVWTNKSCHIKHITVCNLSVVSKRDAMYKAFNGIIRLDGYNRQKKNVHVGIMMVLIWYEFGTGNDLVVMKLTSIFGQVF